MTSETATRHAKRHPPGARARPGSPRRASRIHGEPAAHIRDAITASGGTVVLLHEHPDGLVLDHRSDKEPLEHILSTAPAARFSLDRCGRVPPGWVADIIVVDPDTVAETATYESPLGEAIGIDNALVAGQAVLAKGPLLGTVPGKGLRRECTKN